MGTRGTTTKGKDDMLFTQSVYVSQSIVAERSKQERKK